LFAGDPTTLPKKQFLLEESEGGDSWYEATEVRFLKGRWEYLVRFEGCCDCVTVSVQGVAEEKLLAMGKQRSLTLERL
jgi:hypothetical protein